MPDGVHRRRLPVVEGLAPQQVLGRGLADQLASLTGVAGLGAERIARAGLALLLVMEPGGYRFGDYWRLGLPLLGMFGVGAIGLVPVFWPL
jgi:di/tricarboxylate transporter